MLNSRMVVTADGRFSVVGEVTNADSDPADITVRATIYDDAGNELTWYNAADVAVHKLLPFDTVPFRVDFEGVAGLALEEAGATLSFAPGAAYAYRLPEGVNLGAYDAYVRGVTTQYDLDRSVGAQNLRFKITPQGNLVAEGELFNSGLVEAVIPHVLITLYDETGRVLWVDQSFLRESILPFQTLAFTQELTPLANLRPLALPDPAGASAESLVRPDMIPLPAGAGYAYATIAVNYYTGAR